MIDPPKISDAEEAVLIEEVKREAPDLWKRCCPRIYDEQDCGKGFYPVRKLATQLFGVAFKVAAGIVGEAEKAEIMWASRMAQFRVPTYWVARDMAEAIKQTTPPVKLAWHDAPFPMEAAAFMLPKGSLVHPLEGDAVFVSFSRCRKGDWVPSIAPGGPAEWQSMNGSLVCIALTATGGHLIHWNYTDDMMPVIDVAHIDSFAADFEAHPRMSGWIYKPEMTHEDNLFMIRVCHFIFGTLQLMLAKPELVGTGSLRKRVKDKHDPKLVKEFWSPSIIGKSYKIRHLYIPQGGTHASPRIHWVRGYYREQPYGPERSYVKSIWIEPYLRGEGE